MTSRSFIAGPNFSGRSAMLAARLAGTPGTSFLIGPYAEAALSGLASTVADEIAVYRAGDTARDVFAPLDFAAFAARKPPTLSGGEQVLLALHCFSQSRFARIGIDTALEQLDPAHCAAALDFLSCGDFEALLIDNRFDAPAGRGGPAPPPPAARRTSPAIRLPQSPSSVRAPRRRSRSKTSRSAIAPTRRSSRM